MNILEMGAAFLEGLSGSPDALKIGHLPIVKIRRDRP
jgi:hypothetical protein